VSKGEDQYPLQWFEFSFTGCAAAQRLLEPAPMLLPPYGLPAQQPRRSSDDA
jgi:hypothetical protein